MIKIMCVLGTRPEFIRFCPILKEIDSRSDTVLQLVHTGQHYSSNMDKVFFEELGLPTPDKNFNIGPCDPVEQISKIIIETGNVLEELAPDCVCVWGDTNSSLGVALATIKKNIPLIHLESGCRSYDRRMSEEANRIIIDHCAALLIAFSESSQKNLTSEKVPGTIIKTGNPHYDVFLRISKRAPLTNVLDQLGVKSSEYILVTSHRAENVDNFETMRNIVKGIAQIDNILVIFPIHPRTRTNLERFNLLSILEANKKIKLIDPVGYEEMVDLILGSKIVVTDSGGLQLEAYFAKKPCITIRKSTEWIETVEIGVNSLVDPGKRSIFPAIKKTLLSCANIQKIFNKKKNIHLYGNGNSSKTIVDTIIEFTKRHDL